MDTCNRTKYWTRSSTFRRQNKVYATRCSPIRSYFASSSDRDWSPKNSPYKRNTNLEMDNRPLLKKVTIDCPICSSRNYYQVGQTREELLCEDCGFVLSEYSTMGQIDSGECVFCGNIRFYYESPFSLSFLGHDSVCYLCEAHYKNTKMNDPDAKYSPKAFEDVQQTSYALSWKERVERYLNPSEKN